MRDEVAIKINKTRLKQAFTVKSCKSGWHATPKDVLCVELNLVRAVQSSAKVSLRISAGEVPEKGLLAKWPG